MSIKENLEQVKQNIANAAVKAGKRPEDIVLVMATKTVDTERIREAIKVGGRIIGENKIQEALKKYEALKDEGAEWHFIGHLQTNKVKDVLKFADMIHSVDRLSLVEKLDQRLQQEGRSMDILVQVNTSHEESKYGVSPEEAIPLVRQTAKYDTLKIYGLMTIGLFTKDEVKIRKCFKVLKEINDNIIKEGIDRVQMKYLSMGMSGDYQIAIEEGANMVRIGTAIFGARNTPDAYYWPSEKTDADRAKPADKKVENSTGIAAGRNVNIGNVSGRVAIGKNIIQTQSIGQVDLEELRKSLLDFQKRIANLGLSSEDQSIINGDINAAIKEANKEKPVLLKIKERFESSVNTIKEAGKTIKDISELYETATKIAKLVGIGLSFLF